MGVSVCVTCVQIIRNFVRPRVYWNNKTNSLLMITGIFAKKNLKGSKIMKDEEKPKVKIC